MRKYFNDLNIYTLLLVCNILPTEFTHFPLFVDIIIYYTSMAWGLYYTLEVIQKYRKTRFIKALLIFLGVMTLYGIFRFISPEEIRYNTKNIMGALPASFFIKNLFSSILPIFAYFQFASKGKITEKWLKSVCVCLLFVSILKYVTTYERMLLSHIYGEEEFTNNASYYFLSIFPLLVLFNNKKLIQLPMLLVMMYFIIMGMKRGCILIAALSALYFIFQSYKSTKSLWQRLLIIASVLVVCYFGYNLIVNLLANSDYFNARIEQTASGYMSGRNYLYDRLTKYLLHEADIFQLIAGSGIDATVKIAGNFAHQDWLEIAVNCGILGVAVYISYYIGLIKDIKGLKAVDNNAFVIMSMCAIIMFSKSMFSMNYSEMNTATTICLGYCSGLYNIYLSRN